MARKEINVFNVSFLDLLSGALGAVLLLFIVIPKLDASIAKKLEKLESIEELEVDAQEIESMMSQLKSSVSQSTFNGLKVKVDNLNAHVASLGAEEKRLQQLLGQCRTERAEYIERIKKLSAEVEQMKSKLENDTNVNQELLAENEALKDEVTKKEKQITYDKKKIESLESQAEELKEEMAKADRHKELYKEEIKQLKEEIEAAESSSSASAQVEQKLEQAENKIEQLTDKLQQYEEKLGLKFEDKNIVFMVDVSGSMDEDPEPEKLNEVRAGIKMLIANMDESYKVDIVIFPKGPQKDYDYLYGGLKPVNQKTKYEIYNYLSALYARNCTPTRAAMDFVFKSPNYKSAGTITFMSDGTPTKRSGTACPDDPIDSVLSHIKSLNKGSKVINTIGVGRDYRQANSAQAKVAFMKQMAKQNNGFYIGF